MADGDSASKVGQLNDWASERGIYTDRRVSVREMQELDGFAVFADAPIEKNCVVMKVPKSALLGYRNCAIADLIHRSNMERMVKLTMAYIYEHSRVRESPWYGFIQILPTMEHVPRYWTKDEQDWLKGTEVESVGGLDIGLVRRMFNEQVQPFIQTHQHDLNMTEEVTFDRFAKALSTVGARAFEIDNYHEIAIVPMSVMLNHSDKEDVHFEGDAYVCDFCGKVGACDHVQHDSKLSGSRDQPLDGDRHPKRRKTEDSKIASEDADDTVDLRTIRDVPKGTEIFNTYGRLGNDVLLARYGFSLWQNSHDRVSVKVEVNRLFKKSEQLQKVRSWWKTQGASVCNVLGIVGDPADSEDEDDDQDEDDEDGNIQTANGTGANGKRSEADGNNEADDQVLAESDEESDDETDESDSEQEAEEFDDDWLTIFFPSSPHRALILTLLIYHCGSARFKRFEENLEYCVNYLNEITSSNEDLVIAVREGQTPKLSKAHAPQLKKVYETLCSVLESRMQRYADAKMTSSEYGHLLKSLNMKGDTRKVFALRVIGSEKAILENCIIKCQSVIEAL